MLLQDIQSETLIKISDITALIDPMQQQISGRSQAGEEEQSPEGYAKSQLRFPSGEHLPQCWMDVNYRQSR